MKNFDFKNIQANPKFIFRILALAVAAALVACSIYNVDATEQAVVTRFGRYYATVGPGLRFKIPFVDKFFRVQTTLVQTEQFGFRTTWRQDKSGSAGSFFSGASGIEPGSSRAGSISEYANNILDESTMLTGDLNIVDVEWIIQYRIVDPVAWLFSVDERVRTIRDVSKSVVNQLVGDRSIFDVMGEGRARIEESAVSMMNENFRQFNLGIDVMAVKLQNIVPPSGVQDAFEDVNKAVQDMNRSINEGREAYNAEIPKAQGEADRLVQVAQGYAGERVNRAKGDVARFDAVYAEYKRSPAVTRQRLYLEMMDEILSSGEKSVVIDKNLKSVLPVKKLGE